eukprot:CAMPEP_0178562278 /NCGR_PEP_ID=MMETSP0697-20121206/12442_1 /TAXON_ID=265572 /ORGANISM="Extubocellulus spinifer, Strain CCMP396" /LENGTH=51 /DNA_ID=CAMNT_0020195605 /DNA_START=48 /DNA_END=200 /DNA_ORIENTATION=-
MPIPPRRNPAGGAVPWIMALPLFDSAAAAPMLRANRRMTDDIVVRITCAHQ